MKPLLLFLPGFVVYAGDRLLSVPSLRSEVAVRLAAGLDEHPARVVGARRFALGARLCAGRAQRARAVLLRQDHHRPLLDPAIRLPRRPAASPIAISALRARATTRARKLPIRPSCSAALPMPRCCCAPSKAARSARSGRSACCRSPRRSGAVDPRHSRSRHFCRARCRRQRPCGARHVDLARDLHAVGIRAGCQARSDLDARAPPRAYGQPAAFAR